MTFTMTRSTSLHQHTMIMFFTITMRVMREHGSIVTHLLPTGPEMESVRRNKHMFGNKLDDIQLSSLSSSSTSTPKNPDTVTDSTQSDVMKSSLLVDTSNSFSEPYDMSLIELDVSNYPSKFLQQLKLDQ
ncbi:hypothetical protein CFP56_035486, partial [Quercus suber]